VIAWFHSYTSPHLPHDANSHQPFDQYRTNQLNRHLHEISLWFSRLGPQASQVKPMLSQ
jgi:hypothetical protein